MSLEELIGKKIKETRESQHISQESFAEMVGISVSYISKIEIGNKLPSIDTLVDICRVLDVTIDYIVSNNEMSYEQQILKLLQNCSEDEIEIIIKTAYALKQALKDKRNQ